MSAAPDPDFATPHERFDARLQRRSATVLKARILQAERESVQGAAQSLADDATIERAAALVVKARRRHILGTGKSHGYAALLAGDLESSLTHVNLVAPNGLNLLSDVRDSDVLVAISLRRYRRDTVMIARQFAQAGGTLVLVTDQSQSPLADFAAEQVVVSTGSASYADSPTALALVLHLIASLTAASAKGASRRLRERDRLGSELQLYYDDGDEATASAVIAAAKEDAALS